MNVFSIFDSIDGEVNFHGQGHITTFIRLAHCNLKCKYCDTKQAQDADNSFVMSPSAIVDEVMKRKAFKVTITGGEPLMQATELEELVRLLWAKHVFSTIETNGSLPIPVWPCTWVADYKLKGSGMQKHMDVKNLLTLNPDSFVKFVCTDRKDYEEAKKVMVDLRTRRRWVRFALSPVMPGLNPADLIRWTVEDGLTSVIINIQIHKLLDLTEDRETLAPQGFASTVSSL